MCRGEISFQIFRWITGTKGNGMGASCLRYNIEAFRIVSNEKPLMLRPEGSDVTRMISHSLRKPEHILEYRSMHCILFLPMKSFVLRLCITSYHNWWGGADTAPHVNAVTQ